MVRALAIMPGALIYIKGFRFTWGDFWAPCKNAPLDKVVLLNLILYLGRVAAELEYQCGNFLQDAQIKPGALYIIRGALNSDALYACSVYSP